MGRGLRQYIDKDGEIFTLSAVVVVAFKYKPEL